MTERSTQPPTFVLSTRDTDPRSAYDIYREAVSPVFEIALPDGASPDDFRCDVCTWHLGSLMIGSFESTALGFERSALLATSSGMDHLMFQLYQTGGFTGHADDRAMTVAPGDICLFDMLRTLKTRATAFGNISVMVPRTCFAGLRHDLDGLNGVVLAGSDPQTALLADYLEALVFRLPSLTLGQGEAAAKSIVSLLIAVLEPVLADLGGQAARRPHPPVVAITRFIDRTLGDPELCADSLADRFGMSRATLSRHFEPLGGVSTYIRQRRLRHAALDLSSADGGRRKIAEIAFRWGFDNDRSFARAFKAQFGLSPEMVRADASRNWAVPAGADGNEPSQQRFRRWLRTLRA